MDQLARDRAATRADLAVLYAPIEEHLLRVEAILQDALQSEHPFVDRLARYGFQLGGKRLRPALVLIAGMAVGTVDERHHLLGAVVELIHTSSLVHDDVLDEATIRRHLATMNARWDNEASILLGDFLFARAIRMASSLDTSFACQAVCRASEAMCEGELQQVERRGRFDMTEDDYLRIIAGKTASLIACCCAVGAHYAGGTPEQCQRLERYGEKLGIAFQIADDILDVTGDERLMGKSLGTDLIKQKPTLPVIRLLAEATAGDRESLVDILTATTNHRAEALESWFVRYDAVEHARRRAEDFARQAVAELDVLPPSPAKEMLTAVARFVVDRQR